MQRFKRLQHLLEKSSVYSKFMLQQMERQKEEEKSKSSRKERRKKQVDVMSRSVRTGQCRKGNLSRQCQLSLV